VNSRRLEAHRRPVNILVPDQGHHETLYPRSSATTYIKHQDGSARGSVSMNQKRTWLRQLVDLDPLTMRREKFQQRNRVQ